MSIIFCGDLVLPYHVNVDYSSIKHLFEGKRSIANLEGSIWDREPYEEDCRWKDKYSLYSCPQVLDVLKDLNIEAVSLCNNHILDYKHDISDTVRILQDNNVDSWGLNNHDVYESELNEKKLFVITFATFACEHSLNLFSPSLVVKTIKQLREENSGAYIVVFPHWGREKFPYPEPADRTLAHECIDAGADLIVGHHPHVLQPVEKYEGKWIVYSIGNFILPEANFAGKFSPNTNKENREMVVEWDGKNVELIPLVMNPTNNRIEEDMTFDTGKLFSLFGKNPSRYEYLKIYLKHSPLMDILLRSRYFSTSWGEKMCKLQRNSFRAFRKIMINVGLHHPK